MNILVIGGTRFFGVPMVNKLLEEGHKVTIATRGNTKDSWGDKVVRKIIDRSSEESMKELLDGESYDVVIDKICYCSMDIKRISPYLNCGLYIQMSTTAVYPELKPDTMEFDCDTSTASSRVVWQERADSTYEEVKLNAEKAVYQVLANRYSRPSPRSITVRYPYVIGEHDYTNRLKFYVDHIKNEVPMYIDNLDNAISFIDEKTAGEFIAFLATDPTFCGPINGALKGNISIKRIIDYIEEKTGKNAILDSNGEAAPYNGTPTNTINTEMAEILGFDMPEVETELFKILDLLLR